MQAVLFDLRGRVCGWGLWGNVSATIVGPEQFWLLLTPHSSSLNISELIDALVCGMGGAVTTIYFLVYNWLRGPSPYPKQEGWKAAALHRRRRIWRQSWSHSWGPLLLGWSRFMGLKRNIVSKWGCHRTLQWSRVAAVGFYMILHSYEPKALMTPSTFVYSGTRSLGFPASKKGVRGQDFGNFVAVGLWCCRAFMTTKPLLPCIDGLLYTLYFSFRRYIIILSR